MKAVEIKPNVFWVGSIDWDRRLFDELIPLPDGTSYNAYLIEGSKKNALIDTVDPSKTAELIARLRDIKADVDYIIAHHAEQDHSGSIPDILKLYPKAKIVCTPKCKTMLIDLFHISEDVFIEVEDGKTLSLGDKTLEFIHAPWVHWPETMLTYLKEDNILFTCDFLGSHLATSDLFAKNENRVYEAAKRYYAEIMMPFRIPIRKNLEKIKDLDISVIAPSHGPLYDNPEFIINAYREWISDDVKDEVVLAYVSMHGSTKAMVDYLIDALMQRGVAVKPFNLSVSDVGELAMSLVDAATVVIATPAVLGGAHPLAMYATYLVNALRPKTRFVSVIGSYGWGGRMVEQLKDTLKNLKVELLEPVLAKGYPAKEDFKLLDKLADDIRSRHDELKDKGGENNG
ncbi:MAG TPA: FprA family A-type flavoprotein [Thermoplasmatales archaeon]|nr:FprA family A-type flavoprotein [Thermoplasmatales archaeon]